MLRSKKLARKCRTAEILIAFTEQAEERGEKRGQPESLSERTIPEPGINNLQGLDWLVSCRFFVRKNPSPTGS